MLTKAPGLADLWQDALAVTARPVARVQLDHTAFRTDPVGWAEQALGVPRWSLEWSATAGYGGHTTDGTPDPLKTALEAIAAGQWTATSSGTGTGKAQPVDEPVLTPSGWRPIGEIRPGDYVIGSNGRPVVVTAIHPQGVKPVFRVALSDGTSTRCCDDHLWAVRTRKHKNRQQDYRVMRTGDLRATNLARGWQIPLTAPVEGDDVTLPMDPYVLGVLLGDGGLTVRVGLTTADAWMVEEVNRYASVPFRPIASSVTGYEYAATGAVGIKRNPMMAALRELGVWGKKSEDKHIPPVYLFASSRQRLALLQGLMDTDGSVEARGKHCEFSSVSSALAEGVAALVRSLGGVATVKRSEAWFKGTRYRDRYRVGVRMPSGVNPFRLPRKSALVQARTKYQPTRVIRAIEPDGDAECVCISVGAADGLYLTRDYIVTHNTYGCAVLILWWLACWPDSIAVTVATKEDQQAKGVWREIARHWPRFQQHFPEAELTTLRIRMEPWRGDAWGAWGITAAPRAGEESSTAVQGLHAEHLLILVDEAPGVPQPVMTALVNTATGDHNLIAAFGNPDHQADPLATFAQLARVTPIRISGLDHPNVVVGKELIPGAVTRGSIQLRRDQYGEDGALFLSRVRGIAPEQSEHALIRLAWCHEAARRGADPEQGKTLRQGPKALGVDVAQSENGDLAALAAGVGAMLLTVKAFPCPNATALGRQVWTEMKDGGVRPEYVGVDPIGVGAATVNALDEATEAAGLARVQRCSGGAKPVPAISRAADGSAMDWLTDANRFKNLRAQMWWQLREDLRNGVIGLPNDPVLFRELTTVQFRDEGSVVTIESKDDIRKRLGKSPDRADAVVYWNWVRARTRDAVARPRSIDDAAPLSAVVSPRRPTVTAHSTPRWGTWRPV